MNNEKAPEMTGMTYTDKETGEKFDVNKMPEDTNAFHKMAREAFLKRQLKRMRVQFEAQNHRRNIIRKKRKQERQNRRRAK